MAHEQLLAVRVVRRGQGDPECGLVGCVKVLTPACCAWRGERGAFAFFIPSPLFTAVLGLFLTVVAGAIAEMSRASEKGGGGERG